MALDKEVLRNRIRVEAGNPKTEDVPDATIDEFIDDCLDKIGEYVSNWGIFYVTTVINQLFLYSPPRNELLPQPKAG